MAENHTKNDYGICPLMSTVHVGDVQKIIGAAGQLGIAPIHVPCAGPNCALFVELACQCCGDTRSGCALSLIGKSMFTELVESQGHAPESIFPDADDPNRN